MGMTEPDNHESGQTENQPRQEGGRARHAQEADVEHGEPTRQAKFQKRAGPLA